MDWFLYDNGLRHERVNILPNFKCSNITIKNSASDKFLVVIIDNKHDLTDHLNTIYEKANLKFHAQNRVYRFLSLEQY